MSSDTLRIGRDSCGPALMLASWLALHGVAHAAPAPQTAPPVAPPQQMPVPQPLLPPTTYDPNNPASAPDTSPRFLFAGAVAMVAKSVGVNLVNSLSQGIVNWFSGGAGGARPGASPWAAPPPMGGAVPGAYPGGYPGAYPTGMVPDAQAMGMPTSAAGAGYPPPMPAGMPPMGMPNSTVPAVAQPSTMPAPGYTAAGPPAVPGYPAAGQLAAPSYPTANPPAAPVAGYPTPALSTAPAPSTANPSPTLYAGIAFELHTLEAGGSETAVDPATHVFHSGERFVVYYRPSLPGKVHVFNVSPSGEVLPIETLTLAAGQLAKLGPYQLTDPVGDEALRLVLEPCSSPELVAATRNIVKAVDTGSAGSDLHIGSCQTSTQPPTAARNIVKATMDGSTGFALDPVNSQELASGHLAPRETTIAIHHR